MLILKKKKKLTIFTKAGKVIVMVGKTTEKNQLEFVILHRRAK